MVILAKERLGGEIVARRTGYELRGERDRLGTRQNNTIEFSNGLFVGEKSATDAASVDTNTIVVRQFPWGLGDLFKVFWRGV